MLSEMLWSFPPRVRHLANSSRSSIAGSEVAVLGGDKALEQISHGASDRLLPQGTRHMLCRPAAESAVTLRATFACSRAVFQASVARAIGAECPFVKHPKGDYATILNPSLAYR